MESAPQKLCKNQCDRAVSGCVVGRMQIQHLLRSLRRRFRRFRKRGLLRRGMCSSLDELTRVERLRN